MRDAGEGEIPSLFSLTILYSRKKPFLLDAEPGGASPRCLRLSQVASSPWPFCASPQGKHKAVMDGHIGRAHV